MTELETRLREALHSDVSEVRADLLLDGVRRGARRRRTRRTTSVAAVVVLAVAGAVGLGAARHGESKPAPAHHTPAVLSNIEDLSVSATGERFEALRGACAKPCTELWTQHGRQPWHHRATIHDLTAEVSMAPDGRDGWAPGMTGVWSTHDGGRSWARVPAFPVPRTGGVGIAAGPKVGWAVLQTSRGAIVWRTPVGSDDWTRVTPPNLPPHTQLENVLADSRVVLGGLTLARGSAPKVVVGDGTTWHRYSVPCYQVPELFGGQPSTQAELCGFAQTPGAMEGQPLVFSGASPSGSSVELGMTTTSGSPVGQVRVLYSSGRRAVIYGPQGRTPAHLDLAQHELIQHFAITGEQAVLSTDRGRVFTSSDGGITWTLLPRSPGQALR